MEESLIQLLEEKPQKKFQVEFDKRHEELLDLVSLKELLEESLNEFLKYLKSNFRINLYSNSKENFFEGITTGIPKQTSKGIFE